MNTSNEGPITAAVSRPTGADLPPGSRGQWVFLLTGLGLVLLSAVSGTALARWYRDPGSAPEQPAPQTLKAPPRLFAGWPRPDLLLLMSAQQHGYLLPCGCSKPQLGGLERRYNLLQIIRKQKGWPVVAVDLGDVPQKHGPVHLPNLQGLIKYRYSMRALAMMGYTAVGVGEYEAYLSLFETLGAWSLNEPKPAVLAGNLENIADFFGWKTTELSEKVAGSSLRVGVAHVIGPSVLRNIKDATARFSSTRPSLNAALDTEALKEADLRVLLYHGHVRSTEKGKMSEGTACAHAYPQFPIILCLSEEDEPPANPTLVDLPNDQKSMIFSLGHKGKYVGALGIYRTGQAAQPYRYRYQLIELSEDYETPKHLENGHPLVGLMEDYTRELKDQSYLQKYSQTKHLLQVLEPVQGLAKPGKPTYVGSDKCMKCHPLQHAIWEHSRHHKAYETLVKAKRPSNRQFDAECIVCHTVGFGYDSGFVSAEKTPHLKGVGCESCHGPGSVHAANPNDPTWRERMNLEWKADNPKAREEKIDRFCQRCHDIDNDVTWKHGAFKRKWIDGKIIHNNDQE